MNRQGLRFRPFVWVALAVGMVSCATPERFVREASRSREAAAERWRSEATSERSAAARYDGALSLARAVALALESNAELRLARQELEAARGRVVESYAAALPQIVATGGYTRLDEVPRLNVGPQALSLGFEDNYSVQVAVRQPLFQGDAIPSALRVARLYALQSEAKVRAAEQGILFKAMQAYYEAKLAEVLTRVREEAVRLAEALLEDVRRKQAAGVAMEYDVLRAEVEVANARAAWIQQRNAQDERVATLLQTIGLSQLSRPTLSDDFTWQPEPAEMEALMSEALRRRPELYIAEYALRMQREALRIAQSAYWPEIHAFFAQKWANPDPHNSTRDAWGDAWSAGLNLTWPLFDGLARRGRVLQEKARLEQAQLSLDDLQERIALELRQAVHQLRNAEELVRSQQMNLQRAEKGLQLVQAGYRSGVRTELDVLDAQTALVQSRAIYFQALHAHTLARLNLQRAVGTLAPPPARPEAPVKPTEPASTLSREDVP